ncbi:50S ribosomal protein L29 [bacterium (candidate division B38) B3_B38]|nr:MAG: 50S ribosomal protein L29 [bacterium (candidate division B38) B3_B38]
MKPSKLREFTDEELVRRERDLVEQLFRPRFQHATGQLDNPLSLRNIRRDIARIKTILRDRELSQKGKIPSPKK